MGVGRSGNPAKRAQRERVRRALGNGGGGVQCAFYCDESGNTGVHWGDPDQPIFVHGGWLVRSRSVEDINRDVEDVRRRHRLPTSELKWSHLNRRKKSNEMFQDFFE